MCHTEVNYDLVERRVAAVDADYGPRFAKSMLFSKPGSKVRCPNANHKGCDRQIERDLAHAAPQLVTLSYRTDTSYREQIQDTQLRSGYALRLLLVTRSLDDNLLRHN